VPSEAVSEAALSTARGLNGADVKKVGSVVTISGETGDHLLRVTLAFETTPARLARETWDALVASTGLQLPPPYPTFDRTITMSESIVGY
jgi:hypothetical protein